MLLEFLEALRKRKVPVSTQEWLALMQALSLGLHGSSLDGFYRVARTVLVKDVAHFDAFDEAFALTFTGAQEEALKLTEELLSWLQDPVKRRELDAAQLAALEKLDLAEARRRMQERLAEQKGRHDRGNRWVGTGGTSPHGRGGTNPNGISVGGGGGKSALGVAEERRFRDYRKDVVLDVRRIDVALRLLRDLGRDGAPEELDLDETLRETERQAGELEVVMRPRRRNRTRVLLLLDVGGSMDPYAQLVEPLFTAASRAGRFAKFRHFYFHNTVYEGVFANASLTKSVLLPDLLAQSDRDEKLVIVGDAAMHPGELLASGGLWGWDETGREPSLEKMRRLANHFRRAAWLNPEIAPWAWNQTTVKALAALFPMFPLTLDGLGAAVKHLVRGGPWPQPPPAPPR